MRCALLLLFSFSAPAQQLWYRAPATLWVEALPVGNGNLGGMVFGGISRERIQFNESTVWTGEPHDYSHPGANRSLGKIRELLWEGRQKEAETLATAEFMSLPLRQKAYQSFGDLMLSFPAIQEAEVTAYRRSLDLDTAVAAVEYLSNGVTYRREVFASYPGKVLVVRLTASRPGSLTFETALRPGHDGAASEVLASGELAMSGRVKDSAIRFEARVLVLAQGGSREGRDGRITIRGADSATLILTGATNFKNYREVTADPARKNSEILAGLRSATFDSLKAAHIADHRGLYRRVSLDLGNTTAAALPTDERIARFATEPDPALVALLFQFGRYLLIASSRPGGQPANLQGIWNESNSPSWDSKYTDNINTEMNYWPAGVANLPECQVPLFDAMRDLSQAGAVTAREHYSADGWVVHHNFDLWRGTAPINASNHGIWQTGGAWLSTHLWEQYLFTGDLAFLKTTAYPLMKGAALFFADALVPDPKTGRLVSGPSNSPEQGGLVMGPTMDHQIVRGLFGAVIAASSLLGADADFREKLIAMRARIAPNQVGKHGQLQEWLDDKDDPTNQHRHVSHLWGVYPGYEITPYGTPELFRAARQSLIFRGDAATGWSMGWKINLWARFLDGDHAFVILRNLIQPASDKPSRAGLYANLFDAHPPFQIDGNFGATAGIAEMLLQSHDPYGKPGELSRVQTGAAAFLHLLPALPSALPDGKVSGLRARGGLTVGLEWKSGRLVRGSFTPDRTGTVRLRYAGKEVDHTLRSGRTLTVGPDLSLLR